MRVSHPLLILLLALSTTACAHKSGASAKAYEDYGYDDAAAYDSGVDAGAVAEVSMGAPTRDFGVAAPSSAPLPNAVFGAPSRETAPASDASEEASSPVDELETIGADSVDQMLIFTGQLALRVEFGETAKTIDAAASLAVAAGGYVAEMTDASLRLRVPSKRFRRVMGQIEDLGEVQSRGVSALDVSEEFHDLEVQLENLKATRARIEKLLAQAKDLTQILTIEKELQRVTIEIDRIEGRMRLISSQAAFSTISLGIGERPQQQDVKIARDEAPPAPPRTLGSSASWISEVGVHGLMNFSN